MHAQGCNVLNLYSKPWTLGLSCLVLLFWIMKMVFASSRGLIHLDPIVYALKDSISRLCFLAILFLRKEIKKLDSEYVIRG